MTVGLRSPGKLQWKRDIVDQGPPRHQVVLLGHVANVPRDALDRPAVEFYRTFGRCHEARRDVQYRRFAAAARPHHGEEFAARDVQRYPFESVDDAVAREKSLADVLQAEHWRAAQPIPVHPTAAIASISTISSGCARRRTSTVVLVGIAWL